MTSRTTTSRPKLTAQQSAAILTQGVSIALSAGAGCGKTFVLTQRFLTGLDPADAQPTMDLHSLVAITFTERAAREMRDRIRAACQDRLQNCSAGDVDHWLGILRGLDSARISTIHSFCTSLLRSQAVEAGIDPRFAVLEPALADTLLRNVIRDSFHQLLETAHDDAMQFVIEFGLERAKDLLLRLVGQRFQIAFSEFDGKSPQDLAADWQQRWNAEFVPKLIARFRESDVVERALALIQDSPSKHDKMKERIANLNAILPRHCPWNKASQSLEVIKENSRIQGGGGIREWVSPERQEQVKIALESLRGAAKDLGDQLNIRSEDIEFATEIACRALRLTETLASDYADAKRVQGVLDFDDLLLHARNLLRDNPGVRHRVAAGVKLLMVDEFQDTDPVQADVVRSLCGAAITRGNLFMVGDRKQSIYRFRRADPTVFGTMSDELPPAGRLPLNVNFRSQPAILNFVNHLFAPAMEDYEPLVPFRDEQYSPTPAIEFLFASFDADGADSNPDVPVSLNDEEDSRPNAAQLRAREADWMARRIRSLLNDPTPRIRTKEVDAQGRPTLRPVKPKDLVILFRALSNVQQYEAALRRYDLDYYLVGGKAFFAQQEVFDLLNLCRYLDDCDDLVGLVGVLRSPFFNLSDDAIHALALPSSSKSVQATGDLAIAEASPAALTLHDALYVDPPTYLPEDQRSRIRFAAEVLTDLRARKDRISLVELLNRAIELTGYDASLLAEFLGSRKLANLRKLIDMARQFEQGDIFTLKDFVSRLETSVLEETDEEFATTLEESGDVIRLMSIHQSKGLEFPVVIVADIDRKGPVRSGDAVLHPQLGPLLKLPKQFGRQSENLGLRMHQLAEEEADAAETIRLFYVACTRAADHLILSAGHDSERSSHSPWMDLIRSRFDLNTGQLKTDPLLGSSKGGTAGRETVPDILVHTKPVEVRPSDAQSEKRIPIGQLPGMVIAAEPVEFPVSATIYGRDAQAVPITSVSRLESIDEELRGFAHASLRRKMEIDREEEPIDLDMATTLGTLVHAVLERVDFRNAANWPELLQKAVSQNPDNPKPELISQAQAMLERFFNSDILREFAGARATYREIDFLLPWTLSKQPQAVSPAPDARHVPLIAGIIDLLLETDAGYCVFDYKTGEFPQSVSEEQLLAPYELQLGIYAHAVEQWFGVPPRELSLIVFKPVIRRIQLPWTAARWNEIQKRVDRAIEAIRLV